MTLRTNIFPRALLDVFCLTFVILVIPVIYWFELFLVVPSYYSPWSFWYNVHFLFGNFLALNLVTNLVALVLTDTSVKGELLTTDSQDGWNFCAVCECMAPPRSWHCDTCRTCILKRDHHCVFSACCVGHKNNRYFMMFVLYVFITTAYCTYFNTYFVIENADFQQNRLPFLNIMFPLAMLILENTVSQVYLLTYLMLIIVMVFAGVIAVFHLNLMVHGQVTHERNYNKPGYHFGLVGNIKMVFGNKWIFTWISPFIQSELPHDGVHWTPQETLKTK